LDLFGAYARFYDLDCADLDDDVPMILQFALRCGSPIVELGCGTGRLLLPLARAGYRVTGVDISAAMLSLARNKLLAQDLEARITLVQQDIRELALGERFSLAFLTLNSFMHLSTTEEQLAVLGRIRQHLVRGGLLLLDLFNPDLGRLLESRGQMMLDKIMPDPDTGHRLMKFRTQTADLAQQTLQITHIVDDVDGEGNVRRTLFPFTLRYLFPAEVELLLRHAGLELEAIYGSYDLDEFSSESDKMIVVARQHAGA
jgi:SAM-dependent methyltransferase